jgi:hypothetical protein
MVVFLSRRRGRRTSRGYAVSADGAAHRVGEVAGNRQSFANDLELTEFRRAAPERLIGAISCRESSWLT